MPQPSHKINFLVSAPHYFDHLAPIYAALPEEVQGVFYVRNMVRVRRRDIFLVFPAWLRERKRASEVRWILQKAARANIPTKRVRTPDQIDGDTAIVVASPGDNLFVRPRLSSVAFLDHGVGQPYRMDRSENWVVPGGRGRENVSLHISANEHTARANREGYPNIPAVVIGTPKLDAFVDPSKERSSPPVVAISFHWDNPNPQEATGTFPYYREAVRELVPERYTLLGHSHPQPDHRKMMEAFYDEIGVEFVVEFDEVLRRADVYVTDTSSTLYEFAALDRPVVVLNAPWFRRDVEHGLRFWEYADVGVQVDSPEDLQAGIVEALNDTPARRDRRREISEILYPYRGRASERAADALMQHFL